MTPLEELRQYWPQVLETSLWRAGGFHWLAGFPGSAALEAIRREAAGLLLQASRQEWHHTNDAEWRGGQPERCLCGAPAGAVLNEIFGRGDVLELLRGFLGVPVRLAGGGSFALYEREGDRLGLHRDIEVCDVTLVTCLWDEGNRSGGALRAFPAYAAEPLSALPADRASIGTTIPLAPGDSAVLLGGVIPHEVTAMAPGQRRVVSLVCYQMLDPTV